MEFGLSLIFMVGMLAIACEAITEIIGASELFKPVRNFTVERNILFLKGLLECKYCLSVWDSAFLVTVYWIVASPNPILLLVLVFSVHRMSNILHLVFDIIREYKINRWLIEL